MYYPARRTDSTLLILPNLEISWGNVVGVTKSSAVIAILLRNGFKFTDAVIYISIEKLFCQSLILHHSKLHIKLL